MSTHEWDLGHARSAAAFIAGLEAELVAAHHKIERLEHAAFVHEALIDALTDERDAAINRCIARVVAEGVPGPGHGVTLHGMSSEWSGEGTA